MKFKNIEHNDEVKELEIYALIQTYYEENKASCFKEQVSILKYLELLHTFYNNHHTNLQDLYQPDYLPPWILSRIQALSNDDMQPSGFFLALAKLSHINIHATNIITTDQQEAIHAALYHLPDAFLSYINTTIVDNWSQK